MSRYANQTLHDPKTGKTIDVQVEFTEHEIVARGIVRIACENGQPKVADLTVQAASHVDAPPLTSGHEPKDGPDHAKVVHGDK